jgi:excisionase family DNA binding protein
MVDHAISIPPQDADVIRDVDRVLQLGPTQLIGRHGEHANISVALQNVLLEIVRGLKDGRSLVLLPEEKQLTTQQAGELLGMSRPYVIRMLDAGEMPYHLVGKHRRVLLRDVLAYAKRRAAARRAALDQMARDAYQAGLYDEVAGEPEA